MHQGKGYVSINEDTHYNLWKTLNIRVLLLNITGSYFNEYTHVEELLKSK